MASTGKRYAQVLLQQQFSELSKNPPQGVSVGLKDDDLFTWNVLIVGPAGTPYEEGFFKAELKFPEDFPNNPPDMKFSSEMWHPNIYEDGRVCISILHPPGTDEMNELETQEERWRPIIGVEAILMSVVSMLADPNINSPANIDAAKMFRDDWKQFRRKVRRTVEKSLDE